MAAFVNRKNKCLRAQTTSSATGLDSETCYMSQTDRNAATEPARTVSKADGTVYQVVELNTRQSQTHTHAHTQTLDPEYLRWTVENRVQVSSLDPLFVCVLLQLIWDNTHGFSGPGGLTTRTYSTMELWCEEKLHCHHLVHMTQTPGLI